MPETDSNQNYEAPTVPKGIVTSLQEELEVELLQLVDRLPEARLAIESQWTEGIIEARFSLEWGDPVNVRLGKLATTLKQWMEQDYGEGMVQMAVRGRGRPGDQTDEIVAVNNIRVRRERLVAGAVDISESALRAALAHAQANKNQAIDYQDYESAAIWRDNEKNILLALGGLGLVPPNEHTPNI